MNFSLKKWANNKLDATYKSIFNSNVDALNGMANWFDTRDKATNTRIDNLVLKSGGNSPNEIVDARVGADGTVYNTLKERLDAEQNMCLDSIDNFNTRLTSYDTKIAFLQSQLESLYDQNKNTITLYVSSEYGNNTIADGTEEKPFKTIQAAIDKMPIINSSSYIISIDKGYYLEDVKIIGIQNRSIEIRSVNYSTLDANPTDTGVYVRSIYVESCPGYVALRGITYTDINRTSYGVKFNRCGYSVVSKCAYKENTKSKTYACMIYTSSNGHAYDSYFSDQNIVLQAEFNASVTLANSNAGSNNTTCILSSRSIVFDNNTPIAGSKNKEVGGQIF